VKNGSESAVCCKLQLRANKQLAQGLPVKISNADVGYEQSHKVVLMVVKEGGGNEQSQNLNEAARIRGIV